MQAAQRIGSAAAAGLARLLTHYGIFWQIAPARSGRAAVRLEPVLGGGIKNFLIVEGEFLHIHPIQVQKKKQKSRLCLPT
jgi:hypothetical protein